MPTRTFTDTTEPTAMTCRVLGRPKCAPRGGPQGPSSWARRWRSTVRAGGCFPVAALWAGAGRTTACRSSQACVGRRRGPWRVGKRKPQETSMHLTCASGSRAARASALARFLSKLHSSHPLITSTHRCQGNCRSSVRRVSLRAQLRPNEERSEATATRIEHASDSLEIKSVQLITLSS